MTTYCSDCDNIHADGAAKEPWHWRCIRVAIRPGYGFVSRDFSPYPPYARCADINKVGECEFFSPKREMESERKS